MLTDQEKKQIMESLLESVSCISNKEYQKRVWIRAEGPEVDDFDDTCNYFFDEVDGVLENYQGFGITNQQYQILKDFRDKFDIFSDDNFWAPFFIDTPEWAQIMDEAKKVLKAFNYVKPDEKEGV